MRGREHYERVEELLAEADRQVGEFGGVPMEVPGLTALAQVHATLALVGATIDAAEHTEGASLLHGWDGVRS